MKLTLNVNGRDVEVEANPYARLLDVVRDVIGLKGTKEGCGEGECGACTVLIDGEVVNSCLVAAGQAQGTAIQTIEDLANDTLGAKIQDALIQFGGTQCGICTPGIALCATKLLKSEPGASRERIRELLAGNICRCTGYQLIVDAVAACQED